ncbi:MAG: PAS domain S-box protein [Campylobacterales bacterium]|nr:PAS domain S-box protein [Campylobacterales bacterium]HEO97853.1 PAS domain S-box protein [Campylobacterota bacterium]
MDYVINRRTFEKVYKAAPVDTEVIFDGGVMITETDLRGNITYANRKFIEMSGFSREELIGAPHSINRHPDMPKGAFRAMWKTISAGEIWHGYVKNMRKDGKYYWVVVYIQPKVNQEGHTIGYVAGRKVAQPEAIEEVQQVYRQLNNDGDINHRYFLCNDAETRNINDPFEVKR